MSENRQPPAVQQSAAQTEADHQRERMDKFVAAIENRQEQLSTLLAESGISFKLFVEVFRRAMIKGSGNPATDLLKADAGSVIQACIDACTAGVLPDGKKGAIVLYNTNVAARGEPKRYVKKAQFLVMYEGMLQIAYASGNFTSIMAHVVYETDEWDYELGITPWIKHKPGHRPIRPDGSPPYAVIAAYAVAKTTNGGVFVEVFEPEDIRKVMAVSRATSGPAKDWPEQMARKGPLRRMWKFLPRDSRMDRVMDVDDENFDLENLEQPPATTERKLSPGFRPQQAISQGADQVVDIPGENDRDEMPADQEETQVEEQKQAAVEPEPEHTPHSAFHAKVSTAGNWLGVKQALKTLMKEPGSGQLWDTACSVAWARLREIGDKTDFVTDALLFECWMLGADPDSDTVEANWRILAPTDAFTKADIPTQERVRTLVGEITGEEAE